MLRKTFVATFLSMVTIAIGHAEKIQFSDFVARYTNGCKPQSDHPCNAVIDNRSIDVTASDGKTRHTRKLCIDADYVRLDCRADGAISSKDIARIEISHVGRFIRHTRDAFVFPVQVATAAGEGFGDDIAFFPVMALVAPPSWAYAAASTPVTLAAEFVNLFIPPTTFEFVH